MLGLMLPLEGLKIAGNPDKQGVFQNFMLGLARKAIIINFILTTDGADDSDIFAD